MTETTEAPRGPDDRGPDGRGRRWWWAPDLSGSVTVAEVAVIVATLVVAVVAVTSLATAHLAILSLTSVAVGSAVGLAVLLVLVKGAGPRPRVVIDLPGLLIVLGAVVLAGLLFWPGFHYAAGDRDPGGYVMHATIMARTGSYDFVDEVLADPSLPVQLQSPGARFPGIWVADEASGRIVSQFYHLWPALLATASNLRGFGGIIAVTPLLGALAVALAVVLARRVSLKIGQASAFSLVVAGVTGALLATNMLEVWQAKYPTAEIFAQVLFLATSLGLVITLQTRWRWAAGIAGTLLAVGMLNRADGVLLVVAGIGFGCVLWVLRRFDGRAWWFAAGLGTLLPYAFWQAYGPTESYTVVNTGLSLRLLLVGIVGSVVAALVLRPLLGGLARWVDARATSERGQRRIGLVIVAGCLALLGIGILRPWVFGIDYLDYRGGTTRSYDEQSVYRLAWYFTWPAWLLLVGGIAVVVVRRWQASTWTLLLPLLTLLPIYAFHARNSPQLMWWGRRFVSTVIIGMVVLIALAIAWLATRWLADRVGLLGRAAGPVVAVVITLGLLVSNLGQSLPLRSHDEWDGTYGVGAEIADLAGDERGIFLWEFATYCCAAPQQLWGGPLWLIHDETSVLLPRELDAVPAYVKEFAENDVGRPLFLLIDTPDAVPAVPGYDVTEVKRFQGGLPHWEESNEVRPDDPIIVPYDFTAYSVTPAA